jgi:hypothetical protein
MQLFKRVCLPVSLVACLVQAAFPQCHQVSSESTNALLSTTPASATPAEEHERENRTVLLTLKLSKSGAVRDAKVIRGPTTLRAAAIKAAKAHKYKHRITWPDPREMMVEVKFPQDGNGAPEIRQALPAGVSSCLPAGQPTGYTLHPWSGVLPPSLNLLLRVQPIMPVLAPETEK